MASSSEFAKMLAVACHLAREAGEAIEAIRNEGFEVVTKDDKSPVTRADIAADKIIRDGLTLAFPSHGVLSEESERSLSSSAFTWIIDPLDGTQGFIDDTPYYAVQIGLVEHDSPVLGVVYEPRTQRLFYAQKDEGAFVERPGLSPVRLRVSTRAERQRMPLITSTTIAQDIRSKVLSSTGLTDGGTVRSVGCKVARLVLGEADVYLSHHPVKYWDSCGPLVILLEAGGRWSDLEGRPYRLEVSRGLTRHPTPFIASNGCIHDMLCAEMRLLL